MYATIRTYTGAPELADQLAGYRSDIEELLTSIPGFRSWICVRTDGGCSTVTVCDDQRGADESTQRAADWLREHASEIQFTQPQVTGGEIVIDLGVTARA
jgi:hypothetical protein